MALVCPSAWAARQAQESNTDGKALSGKHHLRDAGHDQGQPQDQGGTLGTDGEQG